MRLALLSWLLMAACTTYDQHHIEAAWTIDRYGDGTGLTADGLPGTSIGCPDGWTTVRLIAVDPTAPDTRTVDRFSCDAQTGISSLLPADAYLAWLEVSDQDDKVLASSPPTLTEVTSFGPDLLADIYVDAGYATASWPPTPESVSLALTDETGTSTTIFDGSAGGGVVGPLRAGHYTVTASAGSWSAALPAIDIAGPNKVTDLGELAIGAS